jgi:hypothetical protein
MTNLNPTPPPRRAGTNNKTNYYVIGAIGVIAVLAVIFFMERMPETATDATMQPTTEAPATTPPPAEPTTPSAEPATQPAGGTTTTP